MIAINIPAIEIVDEHIPRFIPPFNAISSDNKNKVCPANSKKPLIARTLRILNL